MVVNLCLPHFETTAHCNKVCADGYDVSNLLTDDPVVRRRGFKLEYFLGPPLHVTLHFKVRVELCRVDVELWPCGMDHGSITRRLEIHTCSDVSESSEGAQQTGQFNLVGRCDLREQVFACFKHPNFRHRGPFPEPPPEPSTHAKQHELWSRGLYSLSSVAQLRITIPYGGAASALGIKSLAVWGIPAGCCSSQELEKFHKAHSASLKPNPPYLPLVSHLSTSSKSPVSNPASSEVTIPEEFLDPLTQEVMLQPVILPSGVVVDNSTLEEYQKQEATWGRLPNDPFTCVPFTKDSKPVPSPFLKTRIDSLMLQTGFMQTSSRSSLPNKPQPSKLTDLSRHSSSGNFAFHCLPAGHDKVQLASSESTETVQKDTVDKRKKQCKRNYFKSQTFNYGTATETGELEHGTKRKYQSDHSASTSTFSYPLTKIPKIEGNLTFSTEIDWDQSSHEQRLSESLDQALTSALRGLPTYTSQQKETAPGESSCGSCSCSLTISSTSTTIYSLSCGHLLCRSCLHRDYLSGSHTMPVMCPKCKVSSSSSTITRVHF